MDTGKLRIRIFILFVRRSWMSLFGFCKPHKLGCVCGVVRDNQVKRFIMWKVRMLL